MVDLRRADHEGFAMSCNLTIMDLEVWTHPCHHYGPPVGLSSLVTFCLTHDPPIPLPQCFCIFDGYPAAYTSCRWKRSIREGRNGDWSASCRTRRCLFRNMPYRFHSLTQPAFQHDTPIYPPPAMQNLLFANVPSSSASSLLGDLPVGQSTRPHLSLPGHLKSSQLNTKGLVTLSSTGVLTRDLQKLLDTLEECTVCGLVFIAGALRAHIPLCVGARLEEVESEGEDEGVDVEKDQGTDKKGKGKAPGQGDGF
ncbi:hypothetical protein BS47DRAFT_1355624 [Hydnum rufescens UP504]|uniref:Uncharacterized protein n=1 Tax=Hydnum rufescens UP504 TaxID=1448309 RepID=A0A9P6AE70_9AGAM|nr:hypothetical protein BS47DRAFT_1355624 [Hydnum rufescens UP504]